MSGVGRIGFASVGSGLCGIGRGVGIVGVLGHLVHQGFLVGHIIGNSRRFCMSLVGGDPRCSCGGLGGGKGIGQSRINGFVLRGLDVFV